MSTSLGGTIFPPEIMVEILSRVPAKPLTRFKLVNKSWENLISSRYFGIKKYIPRGVQMNRLGFIFQSGSIFYPISYQRSVDDGIVVERVHMGEDPVTTVLCSAHELSTVCTRLGEFCISNPRTCEFLTLPDLQVTFPENVSIGTAFFGMGYLAQSDEYKVLRVILFEPEDIEYPVFNSCVHIFSTKTRNWRYWGDFPYDSPVVDPGVWAGGCINWIVKYKGFNEFIASFDCSLESFNIIPIPSCSVCENGFANIGTINSETLVIYSAICNSFDTFELWILLDYNNHSTWTRMFFEAGYTIPSNIFILGIVPLCLVQPDCTKIIFRLEPFGGFVEYDMEKGTYEAVHALQWEEDCCYVFPFVQSLVRLNQLV